MTATKCRSDGWLESALLLIKVQPATGSGQLLRAWYGSEWEAEGTRELVAEEVRAYRTDPRAYVEGQVDR